MHCWAGCDIDDILNALDLTKRDLFDSGNERESKPSIYDMF